MIAHESFGTNIYYGDIVTLHCDDQTIGIYQTDRSFNNYFGISYIALSREGSPELFRPCRFVIQEVKSNQVNMENSADKNLISSKRLCIGCPFVLSDGDEKNPKSLKKEKCVRLLNYDTGYLHMSPQGDGEALQLAFLPHYSEDQTEKVESCLDLPKNKPIRNEDDLQLYEYDEKQVITTVVHLFLK
jgi:hypothetical protein